MDEARKPVSGEGYDDFDVVVVGSGAGGLSAAVTAATLGLRVAVVEKERWIGGTSAWSGGWLWIPGNPLARRAGLPDDRAAAAAYLRTEFGGDNLDARAEAFLQFGPEMVSFFEERSEVAFTAGLGVPDFHEHEGSATGGRAICASPYAGEKLGSWLKHLRPPLDVLSVAGLGIASGDDLGHFLNFSRSIRSAAYVTGRFARHLRDLALCGRGRQLVNGNALVARLLRSALDRGVTFRLQAPVSRLIEQDGRIAGVVAQAPNSPAQTLIARRGVVLAAGGFPHDMQRMSDLLGTRPEDTRHYSAAPRGNNGDGLRLGESVGASVPRNYASPIAWAPVSLVPRTGKAPRHFPHLFERAKPGFIAVTGKGVRFANEADSYYDFIKALHEATPVGTEPRAWLIADYRAQRRYGLGASKPFPFPTASLRRSGYLKRAATLKKLARMCGLDPETLCSTVDRFNSFASSGDDADFHRGTTAYNSVQGEAAHRPNPSLGTLEQSPFYAVELRVGSLGTFAGLLTDASARVVREDGSPIPGLFAVGGDMASVMQGHYPSGGITLGPAMTFGYLAGKTLANSTPSTSLQD